MNRKILLVEPNYNNKYPPIGLMKISTYHKSLGDKVRFFKGNISDLLNEQRYKKCLNRLSKEMPKIDWFSKKEFIEKYIRTKRNLIFDEILKSVNINLHKKISETLKYYAKEYKTIPIYDRIYVTTLFTFYWNITIKTINALKPLVKDIKELHIGGVMASLLNNEIEKATNIKPFYGLLDKEKMLDNNKYIIDDLPLDYSILDEIDYIYPTGSAYFTFLTKGCTRKCPFCSVPRLEPVYREKISTIDIFKHINGLYGEQRNLLLMDNNVLASPKFPEIIEDIKKMGFQKGAKLTLPNPLELSINNLKKGINDKAYIRKSFKLITEYFGKLKGEKKKQVNEILTEFNLLKIENVTKRNLIKSYKKLSLLFLKHWGKRTVTRYVDFNQGVDGRYINDNNMRLISEINIKPLRIAFDFLGMKNQYINAVELASKYGLKHLSNYVLYNFMDTPEDLYERLKINVELNIKHNLQIFSFPMKYVPLTGEDSIHRKYVGPKWNKKFLRSVQCILNATKGIVAPGNRFFEVAFGKNVEEFIEILYMPETFILYRNKFKKAALTKDWRRTFKKLNVEELKEAKKIIENNNFKNINSLTKNSKILRLLSYYTISEKDLEGMDMEMVKLKDRFKKLAKENMFINLTLTYDYS